MAASAQTALAQRLSSCWLRHYSVRTVSNRARSTLSTLSHPTFRRKMSSYSFTLEDLKASQWGDHPNASTAFAMKRTGFHRWGFVIYRTTYGDDAAWERYLEVLKVGALRSLESTGGEVLLEQYMDCRFTIPTSLPDMIKNSAETLFNTITVRAGHFRSSRARRCIQGSGTAALQHVEDSAQRGA